MANGHCSLTQPLEAAVCQHETAGSRGPVETDHTDGPGAAATDPLEGARPVGLMRDAFAGLEGGGLCGCPEF